VSDHFQAVVDHVISDDDSELAKTKAELAYALHALEREIAIAQSEQARCEVMMKALHWIADVPGAHPANIVRVARDALELVGKPKVQR
jgi:hypothetical protein